MCLQSILLQKSLSVHVNQTKANNCVCVLKKRRMRVIVNECGENVNLNFSFSSTGHNKKKVMQRKFSFKTNDDMTSRSFLSTCNRNQTVGNAGTFLTHKTAISPAVSFGIFLNLFDSALIPCKYLL